MRAGGFEGLREVIATDPSRRPDKGPAALHPTAGAVAVGARPPLVAYNVDLISDDLELAKRIAGELRERDGGLPKVKAIGLLLENGDVQVSMNLTDYRVTGLDDGFRRRARACRGGGGRRAPQRGDRPPAAGRRGAGGGRDPQGAGSQQRAGHRGAHPRGDQLTDR